MKQKQRIFSLFLLVALVFSLAAPVSAAGEMNFTDVAPDDWYYTYVKDLYDNDIVHGTTPTTFSPQGQVTLGEALKLVLMSAGYGDQIPTGSHSGQRILSAGPGERVSPLWPQLGAE